MENNVFASVSYQVSLEIYQLYPVKYMGCTKHINGIGDKFNSMSYISSTDLRTFEQTMKESFPPSLYLLLDLNKQSRPRCHRHPLRSRQLHSLQWVSSASLVTRKGVNHYKSHTECDNYTCSKSFRHFFRTQIRCLLYSQTQNRHRGRLYHQQSSRVHLLPWVSKFWSSLYNPYLILGGWMCLIPTGNED